jgi:hypothetical protein
VPGAAARDDGHARAISVGADDDLDGGEAVEAREPAARERDLRVDGLGDEAGSIIDGVLHQAMVPRLHIPFCRRIHCIVQRGGPLRQGGHPDQDLPGRTIRSEESAREATDERTRKTIRHIRAQGSHFGKVPTAGRPADRGRFPRRCSRLRAIHRLARGQARGAHELEAVREMRPRSSGRRPPLHQQTRWAGTTELWTAAQGNGPLRGAVNQPKLGGRDRSSPRVTPILGRGYFMMRAG